ncbi:MAG: MaoC family dehydratase [Noviherbaspirillum sp.]
MSFLFRSPQDFFAKAGQTLGATDWLPIEQSRIDLFADATGDHQWIHVDPERAKSGPFGGCIAHGYLTLSLVNLFLPQLVQVENLAMGVNYGCDKVRFPAPVPAGARIRGVGELLRVEELPNRGVQSTVRVTVEIEGQGKPGCVADTISRYFFI